MIKIVWYIRTKQFNDYYISFVTTTHQGFEHFKSKIDPLILIKDINQCILNMESNRELCKFIIDHKDYEFRDSFK